MCMWHWSPIQGYSGRPYKLWTGQCLKKKKKRCSFLSNLVVIQHFFPLGLVGEWHLSNSLTCTFQTTFPIYHRFSLPTLKYSHLLEAEKHASLVPTCSFHVNAVGKKRNYESLCYSLDQKCVDKMHLCTYYNSPPFGGKCKYPSSQHCCGIFWIVSRKNIHCVYFLPSCPIACPPLLHCSNALSTLQIAACILVASSYSF